MLVHPQRIGRAEHEHRGEQVPLDLEPGIRAVAESIAHQRVAGADQAGQQDAPVGDAAEPFIDGIIDAVNERFGRIANWCVLLACLISAGNALVRYGFSNSSNAWLEIQWYLFAAMFMLGAPYTLRMNEHVRVDILYGNVSPKVQLWIDLLGGI